VSDSLTPDDFRSAFRSAVSAIKANTAALRLNTKASAALADRQGALIKRADVLIALSGAGADPAQRTSALGEVIAGLFRP